jgi:hypothetical protein
MPGLVGSGTHCITKIQLAQRVALFWVVYRRPDDGRSAETCCQGKNKVNMALFGRNQNLFYFYFSRFSRNCEKRLLAQACVSVNSSARMQRLASQRTDFHEISYTSTVPILLQRDKDKGHFT